MLLDLRMTEGSGLITRDWSKARHVDPTLTGAPAWTTVNDRNVLDFDPTNPDYIQIAAADSADLDFTSESFTTAVWINQESRAGTQRIFTRAGIVLDGWLTHVNAVGAFLFITLQNGVTQQSVSLNGEVVLGEWCFLVTTRVGASARLYKNGEDITSNPGTHINPTTANRKMLIGIDNDEASYPFDGQMYRPRIWSRALPQSEIKFIFERERGRFNV